MTELIPFLLLLQHFVFFLTQCWIFFVELPGRPLGFSHFGWCGFHWWLRGVTHSLDIWGYTSSFVTAFIIWIRNVNALGFKVWFCSSFNIVSMDTFLINLIYLYKIVATCPRNLDFFVFPAETVCTFGKYAYLVCGEILLQLRKKYILNI